MRDMWNLLLLIFLTLISVVQCANSQYYFKEFVNTRRTGSLVMNKIVARPLMCPQLCARLGTCYSFNIITDASGGKRCEVIDVATDAKQLVTDAAATYYEMEGLATSTSMYKFFPNTVLPYPDADAYCKGMGYRLPSMQTQAEYTIISGILNNNYEFVHPTPGTNAYLCYALDMHDIIGSSPRAWQWGDGTLVTYGWKPGQPNSADSHTTHLYITDTNGPEGWNDRTATFECAVICEKEL